MIIISEQERKRRDGYAYWAELYWQCRGDTKSMSTIARVDRTTVYTLLKKYGVEHNPSHGPTPREKLAAVKAASP
jgi:hypothetical protein